MNDDSPNRAMKKRLPFLLLSLASLLASLTVLSCDSANPVAPTGSTLTVTANPTLISLNSTSTITVTGFRPDGNPLNPGTLINVSSTIGSLDDTVLEIQNGRATTILRPDGRVGTATVSASLSTSGGGGSTGGEGGTGGGGGSGSASASVDVQIGQPSDSFPTVTLTVSPNVLSLSETADVLVQAWQPDGTSYGAGGRIRLTTDLGSLDDEELVTDAAGEAETQFHAGQDPGTATITGTIGVQGGSGGGEGQTAQPATATVTIENQKPQLFIQVNPTTVNLGEMADVRILARDNNGKALGRGNRIFLSASIGTIDDHADTDNEGIATATYVADGPTAETATITAILGTSDPASVQVTVRDVADSIIVTPSPTSIPSNGTDSDGISLIAVVRNALGNPFGGGAVTFQSFKVGATGVTNVGVGTLASGGSIVLTNAQGQAEDTLFIDSDELTDPDGNPKVTCVEVVAQIGGAGGDLIEYRVRLPVEGRSCPP